MQFADRLNNVETSAIRELFKLLGKPGIISFAGGFPDSAMFDVAGISAASQAALQQEPGAALQYGATEGYQPLREQIAAFMAAKGVRELAPEQLVRSEEHTSELQSRPHLVCRLLLEKKKNSNSIRSEAYLLQHKLERLIRLGDSRQRLYHS